MNRASERSWWSRHWVWAAPAGCLGCLFVCAGGVTLLGMALFGVVKSSYVYQESFQLISVSPTVQGAVGTPMKAKFFVTGTIEVTGSSGQADIAYDVSGPLGVGTVYAVASKSSGQWTFSKLEFKFEGTGFRIDVLEEAGLGLPRPE